MINFLKKIFSEKKYIEENNNTDKIYYFWKKWEYFLVHEYTKEEIKNFFKSEKTNDLITYFDEIKKESSDIEKNTSLIILLKVDNLKNDFEELKNQIMKIEEDEYFFRKYIIVYDNKWEKETQRINNINELNNEFKNIKLDLFRPNNFLNSKWYIIIQLFIKLPFLEVKVESEKLINLMDEINKEIKSKKLDNFDSFIRKELYLEWEKEEDFFRNLEDSLLNVNDKKADLFLDKFNI